MDMFYVLPLAFALDLILGDPLWLPHPIRLMGKAIEFFEPFFRKISKKQILCGFLFAPFLIIAAWGITFSLLWLAALLHPALSAALEIIFVFYAISSKSLTDAAMEIYALLKAGEIDAARRKVSYIVGRDTANLNKQGISRAALETVAENLVDGVISPLFWATIGGAPLAMAYKMVNTLDSMIGYKNEKYLEFGKCAARIDDAANFIPARLSIFVIAIAARILSGNGNLALKTAIREGRHHTSPNAGYSEAAFAGALRVKLNGPNYYGGLLVEKPYLGKAFAEVRVENIRQACALMMVSSMLWMLICWLLRLLYELLIL